MTEKRYFSIDNDEEYYIFDSTKITEEEVLEQAEYSYDVFADSLTSTEIIEKLNNQDKRIKELKEIALKELKERDDYYLARIKGLEQSLKELKEIDDYYVSRIKELDKENQRLTNKLNKLALHLTDNYCSMGYAVEAIAEMDYQEFLEYRNKNGKPMELQL